MSKFLDFMSEFLAHRKGFLPIIGMLLIICNLVLQFIVPGNILATSNLLLHVGLIVAIFGLMLAWAL